MSIGTALSRLTGFLRVAMLAFALGVQESRLADAYNVANTTPNMIYDLVLGGIVASVFVPVFVEWLETRGGEATREAARAVLSISVIVLGAIALAGILGARLIVGLYTARFEGPQSEAARALATFFLRWFMPQIVLYGIGAGVLTALLNAHRRFAAPMFAPILNNLVVVATFGLFVLLPGPAVPTPDGITTLQRYVLAIGTTAGVLAMTVALWPSLRRIGFRFRFTPHLRHPAVRRIARLAGWSLVYVAVNQVGLLVTVVLAGTERGAYTAYALAFIFFQLPYAIFAVSVMTALLPRMSESWVERDRGEFGADLAQGIRATAFVVLPAAAGYVAVSQPIVRLLLQHGVTTPRSTELVARVLVAFSVGLFPFAAFQLLLRAFYAMQDTRTPALVNVGAEAVHLAANLTLFLGLGLGVQGLALGHAAGYVFAALVAAVLLARRVGGLRARSLLAGLWKIALASALTGLAAWLAARGIGTWLGTGSLVAQLAQVAGAVLAGLIIFATVSIALRVEEFGLVKRFVLARLGR